MTPDRERKREERPEQEVVKALQELDAIEKAILERFGGALTKEQVKSLRSLVQLDNVLGSLEETVDQDLYSRALPPHK